MSATKRFTGRHLAFSNPGAVNLSGVGTPGWWLTNHSFSFASPAWFGTMRLYQPGLAPASLRLAWNPRGLVPQIIIDALLNIKTWKITFSDSNGVETVFASTNWSQTQRTGLNNSISSFIFSASGNLAAERFASIYHTPFLEAEQGKSGVFIGLEVSVPGLFRRSDDPDAVSASHTLLGNPLHGIAIGNHSVSIEAEEWWKI